MGQKHEVEVNEVIAEFIGYNHEVPEMANTADGQAMSLAWSSHARKDPGLLGPLSEYHDDRCAVAFFPPKLLNLFLRDRAYRPEKGALIQFMHPARGARNNVLQVMWTRSMDIVVRRENVHPMRDLRFPLYQRYLADRTLLGHTEEQQCSASTRGTLRDITNQITIQLRQVMNHRFELQDMRLYFKITGREGALCFLYCSHISLRKNKLGQTPILERSCLNTQYTFFRNVIAPMFDNKSRSNTLTAHERFLLKRLRQLVDDVYDISFPDHSETIPPPSPHHEENSPSTITSFQPSVRFSRQPKGWLQQLKQHMAATRPASSRTFSSAPSHAPSLRDRCRVVRSVNDPRGVPSCYRGNEELTPSWMPKGLHATNESRATFSLRK